jgi:hypothetical protein
MRDLNNIKNEVSISTKKVLEDLKELSKRYSEFQREVDSRFRDELRDQNGKIDGLEDFYGLNLLVKRNCQNISNAYSIISRLKDVSEFNISEISEEKKQIAEIFK